MKSIWLVAIKGGVEIKNWEAKDGLDEMYICEYAENLVDCGEADYTKVIVDGKVYAEYECE